MVISKLKLLEVKNVNSDISIQQVCKVFKEENLQYVVVNDNKRIKGIITQNELFEAYFRGISLLESIKTIINKNICIVKSNCNLNTITTIFEQNPNSMIIIIINSLGEAIGVITKDTLLQYFYDEINRKVNSYTIEQKAIKNKAVGFEKRRLNIEEIIYNIDQINLRNKELEQAFDNSPNAFVIQDGKGNTLRVNKEFENITGLKKEEIIGRNVKEMEEEGIYNPAVGLLVIKEKRRLSVIQKLKNGQEALVTGVPTYDENGDIFRIIINSINLKELLIINKYYSKQKDSNINQKQDEDINIVYESENMKQIIQLINELKEVDSTILMTGESGVGKGIIARYIHETGIRKKGRMVSINCGAIPETLLESELLGYEGGAFSGAKQGGKPGLIELANKGTLFLDEIGEMPMKLQVKLLQVLQERKIIRVGGIKPIDVDVRIIAATNKELQEMVKKEQFRLDLFYRLNVIPIRIPSLKERKLDIIPMVNYFLNKYNLKYNKDVVIGKSILNMMLDYDWPGNVRELENAIERMVVTNPSEVIEKENNKCEVFNLNIANNYYNPLTTENITPLEDAIKEIEKKLIKMAYEKYKSSYKVAQALKISQATANRKIREHITYN